MKPYLKEGFPFAQVKRKHFSNQVKIIKRIKELLGQRCVCGEKSTSRLTWGVSVTTTRGVSKKGDETVLTT